MTHAFGGAEKVEAEAQVDLDGRPLGQQRVRLIAPDIAFKITALDGPLDDFEAHARRFLAHTRLHSIAWVNITIKKVSFTTLQR
ncbi:MAG: hypothetical protein U0793_09465 [Gemmataceae bacterium]